MNISFLMTSPEPAWPEADAVFQEVAALRAAWGGTTLNLFPLARPNRWFPRAWYGRHCRAALAAADAGADVHQVYYATLCPFPALRALRRPIIYRVSAGLGQARAPAALDVFRGWRRIVVSNERDLATLQAWGLANVTMVRPAIDRRCAPAAPPPPADRGFVLLAGSAPWIPRQFHTKGFDALLEAVRRRPDLRLVCLWRGLWHDEICRRVRRLGLANRVEVLNERVAVGPVLARCHAAVVLAATPSLVKAYPHSLLEALSAGRPVLVSQAIPMADFVAARACGAVVERITPEAILGAVDAVRAGYATMAGNALTAAADFDRPAMLAAWAQVYGVPPAAAAGRSQ